MLYSSGTTGGTLASTGVGLTIFGQSYSAGYVAAIGAIVAVLGVALLWLGRKTRKA